MLGFTNIISTTQNEDKGLFRQAYGMLKIGKQALGKSTKAKTEEEATEYKTEANAFFKEALEEFAIVIRENPGSPEFNHGYALACYHLDRFEEAIKHEDIAISLPQAYTGENRARRAKYFDGKGQALHASGRYYDREGHPHNAEKKYTAATDCYKKAIDLAMINSLEIAGYHYNMGKTYYTLRNYKKAIEYYNDAISNVPAGSDPENIAIYYYQLGLAYYGNGETEQALKCYNMAIKADTSYAEPYFNKGDLYCFEYQNLETALNAYTTGCWLDPKNRYYQICKQNLVKRLYPDSDVVGTDEKEDLTSATAFCSASSDSGETLKTNNKNKPIALPSVPIIDSNADGKNSRKVHLELETKSAEYVEEISLKSAVTSGLNKKAERESGIKNNSLNLTNKNNTAFIENIEDEKEIEARTEPDKQYIYDSVQKKLVMLANNGVHIDKNILQCEQTIITKIIKPVIREHVGSMVNEGNYEKLLVVLNEIIRVLSLDYNLIDKFIDDIIAFPETEFPHRTKGFYKENATEPPVCDGTESESGYSESKIDAYDNAILGYSTDIKDFGN